MSMKRKKLRALFATVPTELGEVSHRLRHHGKHHQGELWRATSTLSDVINATSSPAVDRASVCYTTNEVLMIIGLTCVLNLAFIVVVMSCVHFCTSPTVVKLSRLESLIMVENTTSDSELEELDRKPNLNAFTLPPLSKRLDVEDYLRSIHLPLQVETSSSRSSSMVSLQTLVPACCSSPQGPLPRHRLEASGSLSMENLLFV